MENLNKPSPEKCLDCKFKQLVTQFLDEEEFSVLYDSTIQLKYKKGEVIFKQGSKFTHLAYLSKGCVKFNYENDFGKNIILTMTNSPRLLGGANFFNEEINLFSITAIDDCEACLIDVSVFKSMILKNSLLAFRLFDLATSMFKGSIMHFVNLSRKQVNGKVADILLFLKDTIYKDNNFVLTLSRQELADFAGCSQENIINTLSKFHKEGIIKTEGKKIEIIKTEKLIQISRIG